MQITFGLGRDSDESKGSQFLGFVFTCPSCKTPVSYQANEDHAVELDKKTFENFKSTVAKKFNQQNKLEGVAFKGPSPLAKKMPVQGLLDEDMYNNMLKDIRESDNFDEFLKRIES
jgi:hypothetical protein